MKMKMEREVIVFCCLVGFLGLFSATTGFAAEAMRTKGTNVEFPSSGCIYTSSPAYAATLVAAKTIIDTAACLNTYTRRPHQIISHLTLRISVLVSLFTYFIALFLLVTGAAPKDQQHNLNNCFVVKPGAFFGGAVLSFTSVVSGIIGYLCWDFSHEVGVHSYNA